MTKIVIIGAGSAMFARQLITDVLSIDGLEQGEFALVDIDPVRLELSRSLAEKVIQLKQKNWVVHASTERHTALQHADFVINTIEVAGLPNVRFDYEIPLRFGVDQCIGDTIGPGGIFKALRTAPTWLEILRDCEQLCPKALVLNYTNPMSILTQTALNATTMKVVGLCHSVQGTSYELAEHLGVPHKEMQFRLAGLNHNAWFLELRHNNQDLYPLLHQRAKSPEVYEKDPVRFEIMKHLGAFVTESSGHFSEYIPYFRKRSDLLEQYMRSGYKGESGFYANNWIRWRTEHDARVPKMLSGEETIPLERSQEYASNIIEAVLLNRETTIYGNVLNHGYISNLPNGCIEIACVVNQNGLHPQPFGALPEQLAALNRAHMAVNNLVVQAILEQSKQAAKYALMIDPLTAAVCSPKEIDTLFETMWAAQALYLEHYQ